MSDYDLTSENTLLDMLQRRAEQYADKVLFSFSYNGDDEDRSELSYRELDRKARAIASTLQQQGAEGQRVLVLYRPGLEFVAAFFGCVYAGAVAVPVHQRLAPRLTAVVPDAKAGFVLATADTQANTKASIDELAEGHALRWNVIEDAALGDPDGWAVPAIDADSTAMIQYTSGSTRSPKGVVLTHRNLMHNLEIVRQAWQGDDTGVGVYWLPPHHDMGLIGVVLEILYSGASAVLMSPTAFIKRPMRWLEAVSRHRAVITTAPNFAFEKAVATSTPAERAALDLSNLSIAMNGGEPIRAVTLQNFAAAFAPAGFRLEAFTPVYGLAEATLLVAGGSDGAAPGVRYVDRTALSSDRVVDVAPEHPTAATLVSCGPPRGGQDVAIVDPVTHRLCGPDQVGEIWVAGPSVAEGYFGRPEETKQSFAAHLAQADGSDSTRGPFLRTGDLGFLCAGELFVAGRYQDLVTIDGHNYYPNDVEFTVQDCDPVLVSGRGAVFTVTPRPHAVEQLVVVQEVDRDLIGDTDLADVIDAIRATITEHHCIEAHDVVLVEHVSIPTTSSGKIQRRQCRQQFLDGDLAVVAHWQAPPDGVAEAQEAANMTVAEEILAEAIRRASGSA
ncbi:fatty acyl-AMP ligase [Mycolicibacter icosiumassiliensis]|uniref:fatty acyl-AMP ligase n=1 Tax=Mycolicibacter icosiumassiliensis TaxID=1792835 RepID=UPI000B09B1A1|nr:fatty acyl-AMP ligase [Mycolicibacter icosiumassiliensis]